MTIGRSYLWPSSLPGIGSSNYLVRPAKHRFSVCI